MLVIDYGDWCNDFNSHVQSDSFFDIKMSKKHRASVASGHRSGLETSVMTVGQTADLLLLSTLLQQSHFLSIANLRCFHATFSSDAWPTFHSNHNQLQYFFLNIHKHLSFSISTQYPNNITLWKTLRLKGGNYDLESSGFQKHKHKEPPNLYARGFIKYSPPSYFLFLK